MEENQENFDDLKRLLATKNHELPPPRFHDDLRGRILAQIDAEAAEGQTSWWQRFVDSFELRPALSTGVAAGLCAVLMAGVYFGSQPGEVAHPAFATEEQPIGTSGEMAIHNPFTSTNNSLTSPPPGTFDPRLGAGLQQVSKTNVAPRQ